MSVFESSRECPNCLTELEFLSGGDEARCPVCQFAQKRCPRCSGRMIKRVVAPEGVEIEADGLPLGQCHVFWTCQSPDCGLELETDLEGA